MQPDVLPQQQHSLNHDAASWLHTCREHVACAIEHPCQGGLQGVVYSTHPFMIILLAAPESVESGGALALLVH